MGVYDIVQTTNKESIKSNSHEVNQEKIDNVISIEEGTHLDHKVLDTTTNVKRLKIAYAVTITKDSTFIDGALVLGINKYIIDEIYI